MTVTRLPGSSSRMRLLPRRYRAARAERVIAGWAFPSHIWKTVAKKYPQAIDDDVRTEVDHALRDWFICCAWRGRRPLGMPSRLVDEAWHALILDSIAYVHLCREAFGSYLHHFPESLPDSMKDDKALINTVWAWDRSKAGREHESHLWDLDERHGVPDPWGVPEAGLANIRRRYYSGGGEGWYFPGGADCPPDMPNGAATSGGLDGAGIGGGDFGGGGDAGGGCGGGGCGGGGS